jgi:hypothetical protein
MCVVVEVRNSSAPEGTEPFSLVLDPMAIVTEVPREEQARRTRLTCSECSVGGDLKRVVNALIIHFTHFGCMTIDLTDITKVTATFIATGDAYDALCEKLGELAAEFDKEPREASVA